MFKIYLNRVYAYLQRSLSESEIETVREKFHKGWHWQAAAEYIGK